MKKILLFLILLFTITFSIAQEMKPVAKGTITIYTGQKMEFTNLRFQGNQVQFFNIEAKNDAYYFLSAVKLIEDSNHAIIYKKVSTDTTDKLVFKDTLQLSKTIVAPTIKVEKLEFINASTILLANKKLTPLAIREILKTNAMALKEYNAGKSSVTLSSISLGLGLGLIIGGGISNLNASSNTDGTSASSGSSVPLIAGIVFGLISIPLKISGKQKINNAVYAYNTKPVASPSLRYNLNFIGNTRGLGLLLNF